MGEVRILDNPVPLPRNRSGEILEDVERPRVKFDYVIWANAAKEELQFFVDYLRNPKRFAALGLKPPKGVLLYGPPGTGKTMLARAIAGESDVAFLTASASSFVTIWQGSGPQNVRDLFV
ncbi:MAG: AAA family ATPase, partial [Bacteroidota bacterium]